MGRVQALWCMHCVGCLPDMHKAYAMVAHGGHFLGQRLPQPAYMPLMTYVVDIQPATAQSPTQLQQPFCPGTYANRTAGCRISNLTPPCMQHRYHVCGLHALQSKRLCMASLTPKRPRHQCRSPCIHTASRIPDCRASHASRIVPARYRWRCRSAGGWHPCAPTSNGMPRSS